MCRQHGEWAVKENRIAMIAQRATSLQLTFSIIDYLLLPLKVYVPDSFAIKNSDLNGILLIVSLVYLLLKYA